MRAAQTNIYINSQTFYDWGLPTRLCFYFLWCVCTLHVSVWLCITLFSRAQYLTQWKDAWVPIPISPLLIPSDGIVSIPQLSWVSPYSFQTRLSYPATCQTGRHALYTSTPPSAVTPSPRPCDFHHILRSGRSTQGITLPLCQSSDSKSTIIFLYSRTRKANADDADLLTFGHRICRPLTVW